MSDADRKITLTRKALARLSFDDLFDMGLVSWDDHDMPKVG